MQREAVPSPRAENPEEAEEGEWATLHRMVRASCVVVQAAGQVVGVLTEQDVMRLWGQEKEVSDRPLAQVMTQPVITLQQSELTDIQRVLALLQQHGIRHLPIVNGHHRLVGIVTYESLLAATLHPLSYGNANCGDAKAPTDFQKTTLEKAAGQDAGHTVLAEQEHLLWEISQRIRQSLDLQTIFETACAEIRDLIQTDRVAIFQFYPDSYFDDGEFVAESVVEGYGSVVNIRVHDHCFGEQYSALYAQGHFFAADDIYSNGLQTCHSDILAQFQVRANLVIPLLCGEQLWGLLCVHQCRGPRPWQAFETKLTQQIANQLAIAIQQANLYHQIQADLVVQQQAEAQIARQLEQQQVLAAITERIRDSLNVDEILATVTQQVKAVMQCDRVIVFRLFLDGRSKIVEEAVNPEFATLREQHWEDEVWSQEILEVYWQGQPRIVPDVMDDVWTDCLVDYSKEGQIQSKIVAPILQEAHSSESHRWVAPWAKDKLWGILVVHACQTKRTWQAAEAQLLQQIANQLAIAIQQANLFEQLQQELVERQQAEALLVESNYQLAIANQKLERATRLKDEFLANMSHELRTPLNAILGMAEGLQEEVFGIVSESQIHALETIEQSGNHLLSLINDILDVSKIESGQMELEYATVSIRRLCDSSLTFIKQQALQKRIQLTASIPPQLPDLYVDERRIRQVLINLLSNAVKFTPEGGQVNLTVSYGQQACHFSGTLDCTCATCIHNLEFQKNGDGSDDACSSNEQEPDPTEDNSNVIRFAVVDTGIGISAENREKLFQPFIQIDSALNRKHEGTGLGLVLVKRIVELHGGTVSLNSEVGAGSCFAFTLPLSQRILIPAQPEASLKSSTGTATPPVFDAAPLILLAEDNEVNISTVAAYLKAKGYRLLLAQNGEAAITLTYSHHPDLVLMDIQMPGVDGLEAIQQIRQNSDCTTLPIIALTALAMTGDRERCLAAGANEYFSKPVKLKQLAATIQTLLKPQQR